MLPHARYLHGFASGPATAKGTALGQRLAGRIASYGIPDLESGGDFTSLTMDRLLANAEASLRALPDDGAPCLLIGSSLGGYTAALLAAQGRAHRVAGVLLIAPAFGFASHWQETLGAAGIAAWRRDGARPFFHFAAQRELPLGVGFLDSCTGLPDLPGPIAARVAIVHGRADATVDHAVSLRYAERFATAEVHVIDGDHRLTEPRHEALIAWCAEDLLRRM
jgi:pimeloyl-ACP methyl ester carboxylesterase